MANTPSFWNPAEIGQRRKPDLARAREEGLAAGLTHWTTDTIKKIVVGIDFQCDFVLDDGSLKVGGALDDVRRFIEYIYGNAEDISGLLFSLDQHIPWQIFYSMWWKGEDGSHPAPFTMLAESKEGRSDTVSGWVNLGKDYVGEFRPRVSSKWSLEYPKKLAETSQTPLIIWPEHCMIGTDGAALIPELSEAVMWLSASRGIQPTFMFKGTVPESEHYGPFRCCVPVPHHPQGGLQTQYLDIIADHDVIVVAGEAEDFCVREGMRQLLEHYGSRPEVIKKMRFLRDCTSLVFSENRDEADNILEKFAAKGVQIVNSTD